MDTSTTAPVDDALVEERIRELGKTFATAGRQLYLVGGSVRDRLLGRPVHDVDLTTDAHPEEIKRLARRVNPDAVYDVGARFGTIGLLLREPGGEREHVVEITTFRSEQYTDGTRKPEVAFGTSLEADLARRDFTMNAIAQRVSEERGALGDLIDPYGGEADLDRRLIRAVGEPAERFREDPLRMLRAVRFAAQLDFTIEARTKVAVAQGAAALERISGERIAEELTRVLLSPRPALGLRLATDLGVMAHAIPEVLPMRGVSQRPLHHKDVFEHTMGVVENIPAERVLRWAALLHDIGKPRTKSAQDGQVHFFGHEDVGARMARQILRRLHFDSHSIERVSRLVEMHLRVNSYESEWTDAAVRRLMREAGDDLAALIHLSRADVTSYRQERVLAANMRADEFERRCRELLEREDVARLHSPLDGNDLMTLFGKGPGPWIRPVKDFLLDLVLEGQLDQDDRETATALARRFAAEQGLL